MFSIYILTILIVTVWVAKNIVAGKFIFQRTFWDLPILIFILSQSVSTLFSIDRHTSIWGYYSRAHGGLLSTISYALLYWAFVSNMPKQAVQIFIKLLLVAAGIISLWAIFEHFGKSPSCLLITGNFDADCWKQNVVERVFATIGQPNWLAAWLVAILPLFWAMILGKKHRQLLVLFSIFLFLTLLFTKSRSGFLSFTAAFGIFWLLQPKARKTLAILAGIYLVLTLFLGNPFIKLSAPNFSKTPQPDTTQTPRESSQQASSVQATPSEKIRLIVWRGALELWKTYPIIGTGVETFAYTYYWKRPVEHNYTTEWKLLYNKAHNEYLNFLANSGIVGLSAYLFLIFAFLLWVASKRNIFTSAIFAGFFSILVTNFFGFSTTTTAILFFLYPGICWLIWKKQQQTTITLQKKLVFQKLVLLIPVFLTGIWLAMQIIRYWSADILYKEGKTLIRQLNGKKAVEVLQKAVKIRPDEPWFLNSTSSAYALYAVDSFENLDKNAEKLAQLSKTFSDAALSLSKYNLVFLRTRAVNMQMMAGINPEYLNQAIEALEKAVKLAPTDPRLFYNLGVLYQKAGDEKKAEALIKKAIDLKSDYKEATEALKILEEENSQLKKE